ncbi:hypothetical protein [Kitasatospora sp. SUK 42]|uniref:hypothetical protein n=1 Tax=Kitasatospora sp. SUK 42 TaxID=1588882 RepID=UPI0018CA7120|nr:hypothetical protein [Kitasatospora sp. SUK 42]MBV2155917.1 hypothetical protein [Kitasatospora sp. SUK 42]
MSRGKLWGYVASRARVLGALGAGSGVGGTGGVEDKGGARRPGSTPAGQEDLDPFRPLAMAGPRPLSRTELAQLRWTGRHAGCDPQARHVQVAEVVRRVVRGGGRATAVTVRIAPGLPVVVADARRLEAAIAGLVDHAMRRNPLGGRVLVRADVTDAGITDAGATNAGITDAGATDVEVADAGVTDTGPDLGSNRAPGRGGPAPGRARVEVRVSDRGAHEPPGAREALSADPRAGGPVGPALHNLVLAAGGRLAVEPTPGGGLTVVLVLGVAYE